MRGGWLGGSDRRQRCFTVQSIASWMFALRAQPVGHNARTAADGRQGGSRPRIAETGTRLPLVYRVLPGISLLEDWAWRRGRRLAMRAWAIASFHGASSAASARTWARSTRCPPSEGGVGGTNRPWKPRRCGPGGGWGRVDGQGGRGVRKRGRPKPRGAGLHLQPGGRVGTKVHRGRWGRYLSGRRLVGLRSGTVSMASGTVAGEVAVSGCICSPVR